jgi:hypothetical protein
VGLVLTPPRAKERSRTLKMLALFVLAALPVAAILVATIGWLVAVAYVIVQTAFLMFGLRQRHQPRLRVDDLGLQYEAGSFVIRAAWSDIDHVEPTTLPSGPTDAAMLSTSGIRWTLDAQTRRQAIARGWDRLIPIGDFTTDWRTGPLGEAIREHRPDLLEPTR